MKNMFTQIRLKSIFEKPCLRNVIEGNKCNFVVSFNEINFHGTNRKCYALH